VVQATVAEYNAAVRPDVFDATGWTIAAPKE